MTETETAEATTATASEEEAAAPPAVPEGGSTSMHPPTQSGTTTASLVIDRLQLAMMQTEAAREEGGSAEEREKARSRTVDEDEGEGESNVETVTVESGLPDARVALYERDPSHPGGEAFVGPGEQVEVARTGAVEARLASGVLKEVGKSEDK